MVKLLLAVGLLAAMAPLRAMDVLGATLPLTLLPELPEPEVFAMMLLGLVLIGYRASNEKFS